MKKVGITVKLFEKQKNDFKEACEANNTDMSKYLAQQAISFASKYKAGKS